MRAYRRARARILRDKQAKAARQANAYSSANDFDAVMTMQHFVQALQKCRKGVNWKGSVQSYTENFLVEIEDARESLLVHGVLPKLASTKRIELYERGKRREIVPIKISDRMIQRVLCDYALVPRLQPTLIYDNGASMKGKGVDFARNRMEKHLRSAVRQYGSNFYALTFDFKSFFDSIPHETCLKVLKHYFTDKRIIGLTMAVMRSYQLSMLPEIQDVNERERLRRMIQNNESVGICLGSQVSQIMALVVPNLLDHYIKDCAGIKHYIRYMDDGVILSNDKEFLHSLYAEMKSICDELGLVFNDRKTRIVSVSKGFTFLKIQYRVTQSGGIVKRLTRAGTVRMRRKLKRFKRLVDNGEMTLDDVYNSMQSWVAHSKIAMSYRTRRNMLRLYNDLFDGYRLTRKYAHTEGGKNGELLQADKWQHLRWSGYGA